MSPALVVLNPALVASEPLGTPLPDDHLRLRVLRAQVLLAVKALPLDREAPRKARIEVLVTALLDLVIMVAANAHPVVEAVLVPIRPLSLKRSK